MPTNNPQETGDAVMETMQEVPETHSGDDQPSLLRRTASRIAAHRASRAATAEQAAEQRRLLQLREQQERQREQLAASQAAVSRRRASRAGVETDESDEIAPVPHWMRVIGVWFDRTFGSVPLIAPLVVSGYFTMQAGTSAPLNMHWAIALAFTLGLEGAVWYLARIYEKTRIEGDSTVGLRLGMLGIVALISSVIAGHEYWKATGTTQLTMLGFDVTSTISSVAAVALMALVGVFVWAKRAAFKHRVKLRQQGLIDARAPKFSAMSWLLCPWETAWALKHATRYRISSPIVAVEDRRLWKMSGKPKVWPAVETLEAETVPETRPGPRLRAVSSPVPADAPRLAPASRPAAVSVSSEPAPETVAVPGEDLIDTVGRLQRDEELSLAAIGMRLGMSKAHAGRLAQAYRKRLQERPVSDETKAVAN